jgi:hypothetical protein
MQTADIFIDYPYELFSFMREMRKPVFHNSNVFLRDVQYAIQEYFEYRDGVTIKNFEAESLARDVTRELERKGVLKRVNPQGFIVSWRCSGACNASGSGRTCRSTEGGSPSSAETGSCSC